MPPLVRSHRTYEAAFWPQSALMGYIMIWLKITYVKIIKYYISILGIEIKM